MSELPDRWVGKDGEVYYRIPVYNTGCFLRLDPSSDDAVLHSTRSIHPLLLALKEADVKSLIVIRDGSSLIVELDGRIYNLLMGDLGALGELHSLLSRRMDEIDRDMVGLETLDEYTTIDLRYECRNMKWCLSNPTSGREVWSSAPDRFFIKDLAIGDHRIKVARRNGYLDIRYRGNVYHTYNAESGYVRSLYAFLSAELDDARKRDHQVTDAEPEPPVEVILRYECRAQEWYICDQSGTHRVCVTGVSHPFLDSLVIGDHVMKVSRGDGCLKVGYKGHTYLLSERSRGAIGEFYQLLSEEYSEAKQREEDFALWARGTIKYILRDRGRSAEEMQQEMVDFFRAQYEAAEGPLWILGRELSKEQAAKFIEMLESPLSPQTDIPPLDAAQSVPTLDSTNRDEADQPKERKSDIDMSESKAEKYMGAAKGAGKRVFTGAGAGIALGANDAVVQNLLMRMSVPEDHPIVPFVKLVVPFLIATVAEAEGYDALQEIANTALQAQSAELSRQLIRELMVDLAPMFAAQARLAKLEGEQKPVLDEAVPSLKGEQEKWAAAMATAPVKKSM